jgi:GxxExxY protein
VVVHRGVEVQSLECDVLVRDTIILELKALPFTTFSPAHYAQILHYLKVWRKDLGLLVNFGPTRAQIERVVWDEPQMRLEEDYAAVKPCMTTGDRDLLGEVRQGILAIAQQHGLGYPDATYRKMLALEMNYRGIECHVDADVPARWGPHMLGSFPSDHLLVQDGYLLSVRSLLDHPNDYEFERTKTYLNALGLRLGLLINFGKTALQVFGVRGSPG